MKSPIKHKDYIEANREMWNETAQVHANSYVKDLLTRIGGDYSSFDATERTIFADIGLEGKAVAQLGCNNGRELISVKKAGAGRCVGFDISDAFIAQAKVLAKAADVEVEFVRTDVYEIVESFHNSFDLVYITIGALGWLPDLPRYFELIAKLLRPKGQLFIYEMHPILNMFNPKIGLKVDASYFRTEPFADENEPDYMDPSQVVEGVSYWFPHKLSDVIGGCLKNGLRLEQFEEYDYDISETYKSFETFETKPPLCYTLVARKDG